MENQRLARLAARSARLFCDGHMSQSERQSYVSAWRVLTVSLEVSYRVEEGKLGNPNSRTRVLAVLMSKEFNSPIAIHASPSLTMNSYTDCDGDFFRYPIYFSAWKFRKSVFAIILVSRE